MGKAVAELFAAEGARLALVDRNEEGVRATANGLKAWGAPCDVSILAEVESVAVEAAARLGGLDGVVNAAGVLITKAFEDLDPEAFAKMIAVNLVGPYNVAKACLPALRAAPQATIVNIASISGYLPMQGTAGYSATKAGLIMFTKCLALELGPKIRANTICPGTIATEMTRYILENPEHRQRAADRAALKTIGQPEHIAQAALYLTSEASGFTTGTEITVDGGVSWR